MIFQQTISIFELSLFNWIVLSNFYQIFILGWQSEKSEKLTDLFSNRRRLPGQWLAEPLPSKIALIAQ